jgi:hypothetical protein
MGGQGLKVSKISFKRRRGLGRQQSNSLELKRPNLKYLSRLYKKFQLLSSQNKSLKLCTEPLLLEQEVRSVRTNLKMGTPPVKSAMKVK